MPELDAPSLAERQAQLAVALAGQADPPPGFDEARLARAGAALVDKRAAAVAKLLPSVWQTLGAGAVHAFRAYATAHPFPGDHAADALAFGARVCTSQSPAAVVLDVLALRVRSGWPVRAARTCRQVLIVARIAGRLRSFRVPWF